MAKKWVLLLGVGLCWALSNAVGAHAVVTEYSANIKKVKARQSDKFELTFNSRVELGLSQMFLVSKGDKLTPLQMEEGKKQGQVLVLFPAQEAGEYALKFKVFAADGHLTEDVIHFTVVP